MAQLVKLNTFFSESGDLKVFEKLIPGEIKRVYYINNVPKNVVRGKHRHKKTWQALICISGSCRIFVDNGTKQEFYILNNDENCLIIEPSDWHFMDRFTENSILLVIANEYYDVNDYIDEPYSNKFEEVLK
jgi:dTDP-4-dehydrorhamnose 3,5-epimerase-like enzyme